MTAKSPYSLAGGNVAITATTEGQLKPPSQLGQGGFDQAVIANNSPWIATFISASGMTSVQPFSVAIVLVDLSQVLTYQMSLPAGGSSTAPAFSYLQVDWYAAGNPAPIGSYPYSLPIPTININTIVNPSPPPIVEVILTPGGVPSGTSTVSVIVPNTIETLVMVTPSSPTATCTVQGLTTGYDYPVVQVEGGYVWWAAISSVLEPAGFSITFVGLSAGTWYVCGDIAPRLTGTQDFADGTLATAAPGMGTQIAGRDASQNLVAVRMTANSLLEVATCASNAPTYGQVAVLATATNVGSTRAGRTALTIHNLAANTVVYIGDASVTTTNGFALEPGHSVTQAAPTQWCAIAAAPGNTISYTDE
jgi:hypothetical protein